MYDLVPSSYKQTKEKNEVVRGLYCNAAACLISICITLLLVYVYVDWHSKLICAKLWLNFEHAP